MAVKCTGKEFNAFMNDDAFWPKDVYYEDAEIVIDGVIDNDPYKIADSAQIKVSYGIVLGFDGEPSLDSHLRKWLKQQSTCSFLVECTKDKREQIIAQIKAIDGTKVLS